MFNGKGVCYWPESMRYEGNCKDNKFSGMGIIYFSDGRWAEGDE